MRTLAANFLLAAVLLVIPLFVEVAGKNSVQFQSAGLNLLLYKPFPWAYYFLAAVLFVALNVRFSLSNPGGYWSGVVKGIFVSGVWLAVSFLAVVQVHLGLGGVL